MGFDPDPAECARLRAAERRPNVRYVPAYIGWPGYAALLPMPRDAWRSLNFAQYRRTSAAWADELRSVTYAATQPNAVPHLSLDERQTPIDVLKVDTDGSDLEVLLGARQSLQHTLAVQVEVQFLGEDHPAANTFQNIHALLRSLGFVLFDLEVFRHSRRALPSAFAWDNPDVTRRGQVSWGDALFARDLAATPGWGDDAAHWKLACIFEAYGLNDCAAELLSAIGAPAGDLDLLTAGWWPGQSRAAVLDAFRTNPLDFVATGAWGARPSRKRLRDRLVDRLRRWR